MQESGVHRKIVVAVPGRTQGRAHEFRFVRATRVFGLLRAHRSAH